MTEVNLSESRPMLTAVDNVVGSRSSMDERAGKGSHQGSDASSDSSSSLRSLPMSKCSPMHPQIKPDKTPFPSSLSMQFPPSLSFSGRPSSVASSASSGGPTMATTSSHSNLSASLLTPTLASALGIIPSSRRRRQTHKQHTAPQLSSSSSSSGPAWSRRPSLPAIPNGDNRMSMYSVASFDSLPEGESTATLASSPRSAQHLDQNGDLTAASTSVMEGEITGVRRREDRHNRHERSLERLPEPVWMKRGKVAEELLETERAFVQSLRLVNEHYYQPLLALSKGLPNANVKVPSNASPVLSRKAISDIFSNFADILHLNSELLTRLDDRLSGRSREAPNSRPVSMVSPDSPDAAQGAASHRPWDPRLDLIGDLLAPMAPFLKMYSFYVKNFSSALNRIETERKTNETFARFLRETERLTWMTTDGSRPGGFGFGLGLQAHLLTIVQRIPRYKLLVGELVKCTPTIHKDYVDLCRAYQVIEQVAESINDNIRQHEMILAMLNIQRMLVGLNVPLVVPGRALLQRATMLKAGRKDIHPREFFLFTDCIIYAAPVAGPMVDASAAWQALSRYGAGDSTSSPVPSPTPVKRQPHPLRPSSPGIRPDAVRRRTISVPTQIDPRRHSFTTLDGQQLQFRGKFALQDCTVVGVEDTTSSDPALRHCFEIRTPGKSFAVYADCFETKLQWVTAIRSTREELMSNRRTLQAEEDSILAKRDRRRSLQTQGRQVSFPRTNETSPSSIPEGVSVDAFADVRSRRESLPSFSTASNLAAYLSASSSTQENTAVSIRGGMKRLEDYNAPVWVPDSRADKCACCCEGFGLWRRKHHCRLCGQVVCWSCSQRSFLIAGDEEGEHDRPARACDTCYESVFPDTPEPSTAGTEPVANADGGNANGLSACKAVDSDASMPSCPPTPTSPQMMCITTTGSEHSGQLCPVDVMGEEADTSMPLPHMRRHRSVSPPSTNAPAARIAKAHVLDAQVFHGRLLSPQVHAATSGSGTFRLVTPRLTTPEWERPPLLRGSKTQGGTPFSVEGDSNRDEAFSSAKTPLSAHGQVDAMLAVPGKEGGGYFAGVPPGRSELSSSTPFPHIAARRRKPMSAAARLSSVYGALSPSSSATSLASPRQL